MNKQALTYMLAGILIGTLITGFIAGKSVNNNYLRIIKLMGINKSKIKQVSSDHNSMSMMDMSDQLQNLRGDDYDKAFIEMMITHHQGAIDMAKLSDASAKHAEIKQLSKDIITTQEKEITNMRQWQQLWRYSSNENAVMMHGSH